MSAHPGQLRRLPWRQKGHQEVTGSVLGLPQLGAGAKVCLWAEGLPLPSAKVHTCQDLAGSSGGWEVV